MASDNTPIILVYSNQIEPTHSALGLPVVREVIISFLLFRLLVFENVETGSKGELREADALWKQSLLVKREKKQEPLSHRGKADKIRKERKRSMLFQMISIIVYSNVLYCCKGKPFFRLQSLVTVNICSLYTIQYNETLRLSVESTKRSRLERKVHVHFSSNKGKSKYQLSYFQYKSCISLRI